MSKAESIAHVTVFPPCDAIEEAVTVLKQTYRIGCILTCMKEHYETSEEENNVIESALHTIAWIGSCVAQSNGIPISDVEKILDGKITTPTSSNVEKCCITSHYEAISVVSSLFVRGMISGAISQEFQEAGQIDISNAMSIAGVVITSAATDIAYHWGVAEHEVVDRLNSLGKGRELISDLVGVALYGKTM